MNSPGAQADTVGSSGVLVRHRSRLRGFGLLRILLGLLTAVGLTAMLGIVTDAVLILPESVRAVAFWVLGAVALLVLAVGLAALLQLREIRIAGALEMRTSRLGTALTNAVQLARIPGRNPTHEVLRRRAVEYGRTLAETESSWPVARKGVIVLGISAAVTVLLWGVAPLMLHDVFDAVVPRFLEPHADHPPYSRLKIEVEPRTAHVLYGNQCEILARTSGKPVEKLFLVAEDARGRVRTLMFRRPDHSFMQTLTNLRRHTRFWVTDGRARSHRYEIDIRKTPQITLVEVKTTYPAYTGLRERKRTMKRSELEVPRRSRLTFRVASNRPLASGRLELTPLMGGKKIVVPLEPDEKTDKVVAGSFEVDKAVAFSISVEDVEGLQSRQPRKGRVTVLVDRRPRIMVLEPGRHAVATPEVSIPVRVRAEDDYAVEHVIWFRGLNGSIERPFRLKTVRERSSGTRVDAEGAFNLKDLGVKPGDHIEYFLEAVDNDPEGPNVTSSQLFVLEVISLERYKQILRSAAAQRALFAQYSLLNQHLRRLAEQAELLSDNRRKLERKEPTETELQALREQSAAFARSMDEFMKSLAKTLSMPPIFDIERTFHDHLRNQQEKIGELRERFTKMMASAGSSGLIDPEATEEIARALGGRRDDMQTQVGEPVRHITAVVKLLAHADVFSQLTLRQRQLARLAGRFEEHRDVLSRLEQMELQEIAAGERKVRDGLREFVETAEELRDKLPQDAQYDKLRASTNKFLDAVRQAAIQTDLSDAAGYFTALDGAPGVPPARRAARKMLELVELAGGMDMQGVAGECLSFQPRLNAIMGNSLSQIMTAALGTGGSGGYGSYGYLGQSVGLYGPDTPLPGQFGEGSGPPMGGSAAAKHGKTESEMTDQDLPRPEGPPRVRLQRNVKFPLRYRTLVGEYFRAVAESQE